MQTNPPLLSIASKHGQSQTVDLLIYKKADPNQPDSDGRTPAHHAALATCNSVETMVSLLMADADFHRKDFSGKKPADVVIMPIPEAQLEIKKSQYPTPIVQAFKTSENQRAFVMLASNGFCDTTRVCLNDSSHIQSVNTTTGGVLTLDPNISVFKQCSGCLMSYYCSAECQTNHWPAHKQVCTYFKQKRERKNIALTPEQ